MDFKEIDINTRNWVDAARDKDYWRHLVIGALNLRVPEAMELVTVENPASNVNLCYGNVYFSSIGKI